MKYQIKKAWTLFANLFRKSHIANICGHKTMVSGMTFDGESNFLMTMPVAENGHPDYCLKCIGEMSIRCVWCQKTITIGSPVTLYSPVGDFVPQAGAVEYKPNVFVGCLRWDCADSGMDRAGFWMPPGKVERVMSPLEMVMATGKPVIVSDLGDINNVGEVVDIP